MRLKTFKFSNYELTKGQKRMMKLARLVETIHPKQFAMEYTMMGRGCGSSGCVMGWAGALQLFPELGYKGGLVRIHGEEIGWKYDPNLAEFLGLNDPSDVDELFGPHQSTPIAKAAQIREYVQAQLLKR